MKYLLYMLLVCILLIPAKSQPVIQLEQFEDLVGRIGRYVNSISYEGSDTAWINSSKRLQTLNERNRVTEFIQYKWQNEDWQNEMKIEYSYENDTLLKETSGFGWINDAWVEGSKSQLYYDGNFRIIENKTDTFRDSIWVTSSHIFFTYDNNGHLVEQINRQNGGFKNDTTKTTYTYNENGDITTIFNQKYRLGDWVDDDIIDFTYSNGRNVKSEHKFWYAGFQENDFIDSVVYNGQGQATERIHMKWYDDVYEKDYRILMTYDQNSRISDSLLQNWGGKDWNDFTKNIFIYDGNGNVIKKKRQKYRNGEWQDEQDLDFTYNSNNELTEFTKYFWLIDQWQRNAMLTYDYPVTGVNESRKEYCNNSINYPNPFTEETIIEFDLIVSGNISLSIFDMQGKPMFEKKFNNLNSGKQQLKFNSDTLPNGCYYYNINTGINIISNYFIINK